MERVEDISSGETKRINVEIEHHEKECDEKNKLRYMSRAVFTGSAITIVMSFIAGVACYYTTEAKQNERMSIAEQKIKYFEDLNDRQYKQILSRLDMLTRAKNGEYPY